MKIVVAEEPRVGSLDGKVVYYAMPGLYKLALSFNLQT
jgi:hypothetical protein